MFACGQHKTTILIECMSCAGVGSKIPAAHLSNVVHPPICLERMSPPPQIVYNKFKLLIQVNQQSFVHGINMFTSEHCCYSGAEMRASDEYTRDLQQRRAGTHRSTHLSRGIPPQEVRLLRSIP